MEGAVETDDVGLEPVPEPGLLDGLVRRHLVDEGQELDAHLGIEVAQVDGDDAAQQDTAVAGSGIGGQPQLPERHPTGGRHGARMPDLELSQKHPCRVEGRAGP